MKTSFHERRFAGTHQFFESTNTDWRSYASLRLGVSDPHLQSGGVIDDVHHAAALDRNLIRERDQFFAVQFSEIALQFRKRAATFACR